MNKAEITELIEKMQDLWPRWTPSDTEIRGWEEVMQPQNYLVGKKAVGRAFANSRYNSPAPGDYTKIYVEEMSAKPKRGIWNDSVPMPVVFDTGLVAVGRSNLSGKMMVFRVLLNEDDPRLANEIGHWQAAETMSASLEAIFKTTFITVQKDSQEYEQAMAAPMPEKMRQKLVQHRTQDAPGSKISPREALEPAFSGKHSPPPF